MRHEKKITVDAWLTFTVIFNNQVYFNSNAHSQMKQDIGSRIKLELHQQITKIMLGPKLLEKLMKLSTMISCSSQYFLLIRYAPLAHHYQLSLEGEILHQEEKKQDKKTL